MSPNHTRPRSGSLAPARLVLFATLVIAFMSGCHSRYVEATIDNRSGATVHLLEVDYPSASFGVGSLAAGSQFHYRFKIQGSGTLKLEFTDGQGKIHSIDGPELDQGQEGRLTIAIDPAGNASWTPTLTKAQE